LLRDLLAFTEGRAGGWPIEVTPAAILGPAFPDGARRLLDVPGYWLIYLPVELAAFFPAGLVALYALFRSGRDDPEMRPLVGVLILVTAASLLTGWLLKSVVGDNNDLGWRGVLPAILILIASTAVVISRWPRRPARLCGAMAAAGVVLSLPDSLPLLREDLLASPLPSERQLAATPPMWQAVRRHTAPDERVVNNPLFLADMTPWPINISWALMADRRSCYAGNEFAIPFAPVSATRRAAVEALFVRVFDGSAAADDIQQLADRFQCDVILVTPRDGAWRRDPFADGRPYRLVEEKPDTWRIYRRAAAP
jgi:hypothetical protein